MLIDALVTDKGDAILRQTPADLIGTPLLLRQFFFDQLHQIWRHFARLVRGLFASLRGLLVRLLEAIAARAGVANKLAADRRRIDANLPRDVGLRVAALQERVNLAALFAGQMEIALGHFSSVRCAVPRKDSLHLTARKTGIHNMAKSGGRKRRPQGCSLRSHRLQRLKPLTPTLSPAALRVALHSRKRGGRGSGRRRPRRDRRQAGRSGDLCRRPRRLGRVDGLREA